MNAARILGWIGLMLCAGCVPAAAPPPVPPPPIATDSPARAAAIAADPDLQAGQRQYDLVCAHCHGYNGEGQSPPTLQNTLDLGMKTVPGHDASGHTWQHPDQLLIRVIREGVQDPLAHYPMPAFGSAFTDEQIMQMLAYIRLWWTDEQRAHQARLTEAWAARERELQAVPTATP